MLGDSVSVLILLDVVVFLILMVLIWVGVKFEVFVLKLYFFLDRFLIVNFLFLLVMVCGIFFWLNW